MKKYLALLCFTSLMLPVCLLAQKPSRDAAEMEAMMKSLQKQMDSLKNDPRVKEIMKNNPGSIPNLPTAGGGGTKPVKQSGAVKEKDVNLPPADTARIKSLPRGSMSLPELNNYLVDLRSQLSKKLPAGAVSSADAIARKLNYDPGKLDAAAIQAWQKGATEESILLAADAAVRNNGDGLVLTNAGAIIDMSGLSEKAIPILRTVVRYDPQNAIALNNLGQAYAQLGMHDSGMIYLRRCINLSSQHPEANNTAGQIELKRGSKGKAKEYFEKSIRGSFTLRAYKGLRAADPNAKIRKLVKDRVKIPEYFNQFKYKIPEQCTKTDDAKRLYKEHLEYRNFLGRLHSNFQKLRVAAEKKVNDPERFRKMQEKALNPKGNLVKPFVGLGAAMLSETTVEWRDEIVKLQKFNDSNRLAYKNLEKDYEAAVRKMKDEMNCEAANSLANKYLVQFAELNEQWQERNLSPHKAYLDELLYWSYIGSLDDDEFKVRFYNLLETYFVVLEGLCQTKIIYGCQPDEPVELKKPVAEELKEYECPVELEIPFLVGKLSLDCEKFSFKAGEVVTFSYEKKFTGQRQSTMSLGIGAGAYLLKIPGTSAGIEVSAGMSIYLSFDNMGHLTDGGLQTGAKASAGIDFEAGERLKLKKEMKTEVGAGWRVGVASGLNFDEGPLKGILNPKEKPVNRNVKVYP